MSIQGSMDLTADKHWLKTMPTKTMPTDLVNVYRWSPMLYHIAMSKSILGGVYIPGPHVATIDGKASPTYKKWVGMFARCYGEYNQAKYPNYRGCTVHDAFIHFQDFAEWMINQIGHDQPDYELDKDILVPGNKVYGPDTCVFVPHALNQLLTYKQSDQGLYPPGVSWHKNDKRFQAKLRIDGKQKHLGNFTTPEAAHTAYKVAKEAEVRRQALNHVDSIDPRVFAALMDYEVK